MYVPGMYKVKNVNIATRCLSAPLHIYIHFTTYYTFSHIHFPTYIFPHDYIFFLFYMHTFSPHVHFLHTFSHIHFLHTYIFPHTYFTYIHFPTYIFPHTYISFTYISHIQMYVCDPRYIQTSVCSTYNIFFKDVCMYAAQTKKYGCMYDTGRNP